MILLFLIYWYIIFFLNFLYYFKISFFSGIYDDLPYTGKLPNIIRRKNDNIDHNLTTKDLKQDYHKNEKEIGTGRSEGKEVNGIGIEEIDVLNSKKGWLSSEQTEELLKSDHAFEFIEGG